MQKAAAVATTNPPAYASDGRCRRRTSGYVSHIGATTMLANFVHADSATNTPRAHAEETSQKPQMRNAGSSASFVFELEMYCVNGYAAHAKASVAPSSDPPKRKPTRNRPSTQRTSKAIEVALAAGSEADPP